jgi:pimeloyl-ACP methyl ester carboxylesterase
VSSRSIVVSGIELCTESFGAPGDPAILLLAGALESMAWWDERFCRRLADGGRFVVRYDQRDTGESATCEPGRPLYEFADLVADAFGVLDAWSLDAAHLVGLSMGAMVAQVMALERPRRVLSLTLCASSPHGPEDDDLPPSDPRIVAFFATAPPVDWSSEGEAVAFMVAGRRLLVGSAHPFDEPRARAIALAEYRRARNPAASTNHALLSAPRWRERLGEIRVPTLIVHGTEDPVLPLGHGLALAEEIPGARLLVLEGVGHELPAEVWGTLVPAILEHTRPAGVGP